MKDIFEFRYSVYCTERGYLPAELYESGLESDEHDNNAEHFCVYGPNQGLLGYVRLARQCKGIFPFEAHCESFDVKPRLPLPSEALEISRLMVRRDHRGALASDAHVSSPPLSGKLTTKSTFVLMELYRQIYKYSVENGIRYWYAAMERALARSLTQSGFPFEKIGPQTDYFGPVAPYLADLNDLESKVASSNPQLLTWLQSNSDDLSTEMDWTLCHVTASLVPQIRDLTSAAIGTGWHVERPCSSVEDCQAEFQA